MHEDTGFNTNGYDNEAVLPNIINWSRQSKYIAPEHLDIKWVKKFKDAARPTYMVIDRYGSVVFAYEYNFKGKGLSYHAIMLNISSDGKEKWKVETNKEYRMIFSDGLCIGLDGTIYIGSIGDSEDDPNILYAFDSYGRVKWEFNASGYISFSPVLWEDRTILFTTGEPAIYALYPDGKLKWKYKCDSKYEFCSSPIISSDGYIYITNREGFLYVIDIDGNLQKKQELDETDIHDYPFIDTDGTIYAFHCIALNKDLSIKWSYEMEGEDNFLSSGWYTVSDRGNIYRYANYFRLVCLDRDGKVNWISKLKGAGTNYPIISGDGKIFVGCTYVNDSYVQILNEQGEIRDEILIKDESIHCIALDDKKNLFVLTENTSKRQCKLYCIGNK